MKRINFVVPDLFQREGEGKGLRQGHQARSAEATFTVGVSWQRTGRAWHLDPHGRVAWVALGSDSFIPTHLSLIECCRASFLQDDPDLADPQVLTRR